ncbi:lipid-A-disaccharide synthase [Pseudohongiella sp.]|uniref:lipid-A-disaccharide synthase n=1 Tax=marine sediment metagenome TaxID=412755 RepID=A0A0F9WHD2_9ZZZZ|nr:lipid-A-disaccharide synthase [Pseudohongiella sp.]HDZ08505.1 lipid-A-disaccharide synthase [Pseudohongiella sp.]HEA61757.1 lipid-A-disaccharide synthase [Pseudohongiella sp.]
MLIGMVAGETSGDMLGAGLMQAIRQRYPNARFAGVGGPLMLAQGFESITPMERLSVMGFVEPLGRLPELLRLKRDLVRLFVNERAAVFIGIDSPGFNLRLEQNLHDAGVKTVHYVSPSVWAWGKGRIKKIARAVDLILALFPFESDIYQQHGIPVHCVGHSLADRIVPGQDQTQVRQQARASLGLPDTAPVLCLMPGSRKDEVQRLAPVFIAAALLCLAQKPDLRFVIPCANERRREQIDGMLTLALAADPAASNAFTVIDGRSHEAMQASDLVLLASGTATLEALLLKRPMVVCYRLSSVTWALAKRLVKIPYISLPNLLAGRELVPELLQDQVTAPIVSTEVLAWLDDPARQDSLYHAFESIHQSIRLDADQQAAAAVCQLLDAAPGDAR